MSPNIETKLTEFGLRKEILKYIRKHFIGPIGGDTEIMERGRNPNSSYLTGVLFPLETQNERIEDGDDEFAKDDDSTASSEDTAEEIKDEVAADKVLFPSSAGMSLRTNSAARELAAEVNFGRYSQSPSPGDDSRIYVREPFHWAGTIDVSKDEGEIYVIENWARLSWYIRRESSYNVVSITLENHAKPTLFPEVKGNQKSSFRNLACLWQVQISVTGAKDSIMPIMPDSRNTQDAEINSHILLYRDSMPMAFGHNCSVDWRRENGIVKVWTDFMPQYDLNQMVASEFEGIDLNIENFSSVTGLKEKGLPSLASLLGNYDKWITDCEGQIGSLADEVLRQIGKVNIRNCRKANQRLKKGLELLTTNSDVQKCFIFANEIMRDQQPDKD